MTEKWNRRQVLQRMAAAGTALALRGSGMVQLPSDVANQDLEIQIIRVSDHTFRLSIFPAGQGAASAGSLRDGSLQDGSLVKEDWGAPLARLRGNVLAQTIRAGNVSVQISPYPLTFGIIDAAGRKIQELTVDTETGNASFAVGNSPLLGLGEGGPQFDRRGSTDRMVSGQGGYRLATHGGRVPIPWLIGTAGWAMFIHQPFGTFDFSGPQEPRGQMAARYLLCLLPRPSHDPGGIRAPHRLRGAATAVEFRLSTIASHPGQPRGNTVRSEDI